MFGGHVPGLPEDEAEDAFLGKRRAGFADEFEEEEDDQREDQRGERGEPVLQQAVGQAGER